MSSKWNVLPRLQKLQGSFQLPEKYKGTVIEKWYKYWEGLIQDYTEVFKDTVEDAYRKPWKTMLLGGVGGFFTYALYNNPDEIDYKNQLIEYQNSFGLVGKPVRNPAADIYLKYLNNCFNYGLIRRFSFGLFSVIWLDNYDAGVGLYKAQCSYLKPQIWNFHERIIDIGFLKKFWLMEKKMMDYDVNPNEWIDFSKTEYVYKHRMPS
ncbi:UNVERIFIED_CONTAM: hypothetical protein PYX00_010357 [Menopon gallinae]|uniref:Uncharacterized protein n=1 Tax=Menopon gallinae TaxID=328185 RepID=A0AAW2HF12_9NEOP